MPFLACANSYGKVVLPSRGRTVENRTVAAGWIVSLIEVYDDPATHFSFHTKKPASEIALLPTGAIGEHQHESILTNLILVNGTGIELQLTLYTLQGEDQPTVYPPGEFVLVAVD